jgi:uncharacterized protein YgbK (DUF1537 family)
MRNTSLISRILKGRLFSLLPPEWPQELFPDIQREVQIGVRKVVVLDDDPTGTQTVHGIPVLTTWTVEALEQEFDRKTTAFYILTNSRSLPLNEAKKLNKEIGHNLKAVSQLKSREFVIISRSDSTLRGHFPGEIEALAQGLREVFDGWLIIPFFLEGGRYTINDIHYVEEDGVLIPAGETEFARDATFGYQSSNLCQWIEEKTQGRIARNDVNSISIEDIRIGGPKKVNARLMNIRQGEICIVNAVCYSDLEVLIKALLSAEAQGKRFIYRTAASFVRVRAGISSRPLLERSDLDLQKSGGALLIIGSHVSRTTKQMEALLTQQNMDRIEVRLRALLDSKCRPNEIERVAKYIDRALQESMDVVLFTSRALITGNDPVSTLSIGNKISDGLIEIIKMISSRPRYILSKGGITSSDIATRALNVRRAQVLGQIIPGVPVWQLGPESCHPRLAYIVFPGNVGSSQALVEVVKKLSEGHVQKKLRN